jgi:16S rRNA (uracil1498-N3)-methyltransferase
MELERIALTSVEGEKITDAAVVKHIVNVLRLGVGAEFLGYDGANETQYRIEEVKHGVVVVSEAARRSLRPAADVTVAQCLLRGAHWDMFIQKCTELGAARILPVVSERVTARLPDERVESRLARWHRMARAAAAQCAGRTPVILDPMPMPRALERLSGAAYKILISLDPGAVSIAGALPARAQGHTALLLGPEGDFSPAEHAMAVDAGFTPAHIGPRILRSETAAIAALTLTLHILGALDSSVSS